MIRRLHMYGFCARLACNLLPTAAFVVAWYVRFSTRYHFDSTDYDPNAYFHLLVFATVVWALVADHYRLASPEALLAENTGVRRTVASCVTTYMVVLGGLFFYRGESFSRVFLAVSGVALLIAGVVSRAILRWVIRAKPLAQNPTGLLIVGADAFAARAVSRLLALGPPCRIIGYVRLAKQEVAVSDAPVYDLADLDGFDLSCAIDDVILAVPPQYWPELPVLMSALDRFSAPLRAILDFGSGACVRNQLWRFGQMNLLDLGTTPCDTVGYLVVKRAFDIVVSALALLLMSPAMLAIAIALRLSSPGPVLFVQDRVGFNGRVFRMYKFRTMEPVPAEQSDTVWSEPAARCSRFGAFLRRRSLDELPQFFNVLKGDMSLVGPRPERPHFVRQFLQDFSCYNTRHRLKVGMTGWAQVNGLRGDTSISERLEHDLFYLRNWSLGFDIRIMFMTMWGEVFDKRPISPASCVPSSSATVAIPQTAAAPRGCETSRA